MQTSSNKSQGETKQPGDRMRQQAPFHNQNLNPQDNDARRDREMQKVGEERRQMSSAGDEGGIESAPSTTYPGRGAERTNKGSARRPEV